jgi:hypothetical protein
LTAGKNADAVAKLTGFQTSLSALATAPKPKVTPATAQSLSAGGAGRHRLHQRNRDGGASG